MRIVKRFPCSFVLAAITLSLNGCKPEPVGGLTTTGSPSSATDTSPASAGATSVAQSSAVTPGNRAEPQQKSGGGTTPAKTMHDVVNEAAADAIVPEVKEDPSLPGEWKEMLGGFRIKLPPGFQLDADETKTIGDDTFYTLSGRQPGEVTLSITIEHLPTEELWNLAGLVLATQQGKIRQLEPQPADRKVVRLNNLLCVHRRYDHLNPSAFRNRPAVLLHITEYHQSEGHYRVTAGMNSQQAFDHPSYVAGLAYFQTLQRAK